MAEDGLLGIRASKVILAGRKGVPHHAVSAGTPIERIRAGHSAVHPVVVVHNLYNLATMTETSVLATTTIEIILWQLGQFHGNFTFGKDCRSRLAHHFLSFRPN